jgi:hypothetical protein
VQALSVGEDGSLWAITSGNGEGFTCAAVTGSCAAGNGTCTWQCNWNAPNTFGWSQVAAGNGQQIYALDASKQFVYAYTSSGNGQYNGSQFTELYAFQSVNPVKQIAAGGDGDFWTLTTHGNLGHRLPTGALAPISPPSGGIVTSIAVATSSDVWVASSTGLYKYLGSNQWEQHCPEVGGCNTAFSSVSAGGNTYSTAFGIGSDVWGLDEAGDSYHLDRTKGSSTSSLVYVPGTLTFIATGGMGDAWGINSAGTVFTFQ